MQSTDPGLRRRGLWQICACKGDGCCRGGLDEPLAGQSDVRLSMVGLAADKCWPGHRMGPPISARLQYVTLASDGVGCRFDVETKESLLRPHVCPPATLTFCPPPRLTVRLSMCTSHLNVCLLVSLLGYPLVCLATCLPVCTNVYLAVCLAVRLLVCLSASNSFFRLPSVPITCLPTRLSASTCLVARIPSCPYK
ncbi:unnamed protein product [Protopolystoma xenopodis]|uniref:Uncharacterized protein n=1 Tax=Protopolystoma xenopodis TaxID=117903 RepID=A0A3S5A7Q2_9PLAT|nr:unnamed protein product [Protopolystoma xenopodis]